MHLPISELHHLFCYEEVAGVLQELCSKDDLIIAQIGRFRLALPSNFEYCLRQHLGQRISILRTDIPEEPFLLRVLPRIQPRRLIPYEK
jgi:hypothetical protein